MNRTAGNLGTVDHFPFDLDFKVEGVQPGRVGAEGAVDAFGWKLSLSYPAAHVVDGLGKELVGSMFKGGSDHGSGAIGSAVVVGLSVFYTQSVDVSGHRPIADANVDWVVRDARGAELFRLQSRSHHHLGGRTYSVGRRDQALVAWEELVLRAVGEALAFGLQDIGRRLEHENGPAK